MEILIVISVVSVLAVASLIALNPVTAGRKTRDAQRLSDIRKLQLILEQYSRDYPNNSFTSISTTGTGSGSNLCSASGWIGTDVCDYANVVPVDPSNKNTVYSNSVGALTNGWVAYQVLVTAGNYRICTKMENTGNKSKLTSDGVINDYYEVFNNTGASSCNF